MRPFGSQVWLPSAACGALTSAEGPTMPYESGTGRC
jgi:hypothetical protein